MLAATIHPAPRYIRRQRHAGFGWGFGEATLSLQDARQRIADFIQDPAWNSLGDDEANDFDVVFDTSGATGIGIDRQNLLVIIHGGTFNALNEALATVGSSLSPVASGDSRTIDAIQAARASDPQLAMATLGQVPQVLGLLTFAVTVINNKAQAAPEVVTTPMAVAPSVTTTTPIPSSGVPSAASAPPVSRRQALQLVAAINAATVRPISTGATIAFSAMGVALLLTGYLVWRGRRA